LIKYLQPAGIRRQLSETLKDYNTWEFERDEEWDEDTRTTALKAHENAFRVLRTLFNDLRSFGDKKAAKAFLAEASEGQRGKAEIHRWERLHRMARSENSSQAESKDRSAHDLERHLRTAGSVASGATSLVSLPDYM
jgi:oligoribonuclease NrnB/cAMP/cGMP phosphodiesterase (DHH superfamily)